MFCTTTLLPKWLLGLLFTRFFSDLPDLRLMLLETEVEPPKIPKPDSKKKRCLRVLLLGSLGPSTVTFMHLVYMATCGGLELTIITRLKLFPANRIIYCLVC